MVSIAARTLGTEKSSGTPLEAMMGGPENGDVWIVGRWSVGSLAELVVCDARCTQRDKSAPPSLARPFLLS